MGSEAWDATKARRIVRRVGCVAIDRVRPELKSQVLAYASFFGLLEAMWRGYSPIFRGLVHNIENHGPLLPGTQKAQMDAVMAKMRPSLQRKVPRGFLLCSVCSHTCYALCVPTGWSEICCVWQGLAMNATGSLLPTAAHKPNVVSPASGQHLTGTTVPLEDGASHMTRSEALMWRTVSPFSPLGTGRLLDFL